MATQRTTLNVSLTPELNEFITSLVQSGEYKSASEVVREGLRLLQRRVPSLTTSSEKQQISGVEEKGQL
jgi:antitoxin ParD1/3/4